MTKTATSQSFGNEYATIEAIHLLSEFNQLQENDRMFILENIILTSSNQQLDMLLLVIERRMSAAKVSKIEEEPPDNITNRVNADQIEHFDAEFSDELVNIPSILFQCSLCSYASNRQQNLKRHVTSIHKTNEEKVAEDIVAKKTYTEECPHCEELFSDEDFKNNHVKDIHQTKDMLPCVKCDSILPSQEERGVHMEEMHNDDNRFCFLCKKMVKNLIKHKRSVHKNSFKCDMCTYVAPNKFRIKRHLKTHLPEKSLVSCHICGKEVVTLDQHLRIVHGPKRFMCNDCSFAASTPRELERHKSAIHLRNKEVCPFCGKKYSKDHLSNHIKNKHHNIRDKSCDQCKKSFVTNSELKRHIEVSHLGVRSTCEECGGLFVNVLDHIRKVHQRDKNSKSVKSECGYCGETVFHLKHHILINHDDTVEKVSCELCPFKTLKYSVLKKHIVQRHSAPKINESSQSREKF